MNGMNKNNQIGFEEDMASEYDEKVRSY